MSIADLQLEQQEVPVQQLVAKFTAVKDHLEANTPGLAHAMYEIHKHLLEHEELVHILGDDDINALHRAHEKHKQFSLIQKETKAVTSTRKKKLSDSDLANL
jgi:hypothetical protein